MEESREGTDPARIFIIIKQTHATHDTSLVGRFSFVGSHVAFNNALTSIVLSVLTSKRHLFSQISQRDL